MTGPHDEPTLDDVIVPEESAPRDRTQHGKDPHLSDEEPVKKKTPPPTLRAGEIPPYDADAT